MARINIINKCKRAQTFNTPYMEMRDVAFCQRQRVGRVVIDKQGTKRAKHEDRRLSKSLSLRPKGKQGDTLYDLPLAVRHCPEVAAAEARGDIRIEVLTDEQAAAQRTARADAEHAAAEKAKAAFEFAERKAAKKTRAAASPPPPAPPPPPPADPPKSSTASKKTGGSK